MSRPARILVAPLLLGMLAVLATAAPGSAHAPVAPVSTSASPGVADGVVPILTAAPAATSSLWFVLPAVAFGGVTVAARRRRLRSWRAVDARRTFLVALTLLLGLFTFENALHSVHHGLDPKPGECAIAAAAAHLAAVTDDVVAAPSMVLAVTAAPLDAPLAQPSLRLLGPSQGRAPPALPA
ncbi:MAG TPA: hypothetical protein VEH80_01115 [Candidatus Bathyarchaeia archaeon]|nr:hypothetical protein [Candidatus Bathyarchaeia archaeon]